MALICLVGDLFFGIFAFVNGLVFLKSKEKKDDFGRMLGLTSICPLLFALFSVHGGLLFFALVGNGEMSVQVEYTAGIGLLWGTLLVFGIALAARAIIDKVVK